MKQKPNTRAAARTAGKVERKKRAAGRADGTAKRRQKPDTRAAARTAEKVERKKRAAGRAEGTAKEL